MWVLRLTCVGIAALLLFAGRTQAQPRTRAELIEDARDEKRATLWPERESPMVQQVNGLVERGLGDGLESGKGANGWQLVLGGMRSGQGMSVGVGYRRFDIWRERLDYRVTARGTPQLAFLLDFELDFASISSERFEVVYEVRELAPDGLLRPGRDSLESNRTSYLFDDLSTDLVAGFEPFANFSAGLTAGWLGIHTGSGKRGGVPSTEEVFTSETTPGLGQDTDFFRWGGFVAYDWRDSRSGARSGGFYGARFREYNDVNENLYGFKQGEFDFQQYFPYFNETRVVAFRVMAIVSFAENGQRLPFYLQPTLGGNDDLRGFQRYRFYDDNAIFASVEHRWHAFTGLEMAVFADAGKVSLESFRHRLQRPRRERRHRLSLSHVRRRREPHRLRLRARGFRWMWTFDDIFRVRLTQR